MQQEHEASSFSCWGSSTQLFPEGMCLECPDRVGDRECPKQTGGADRHLNILLDYWDQQQIWAAFSKKPKQMEDRKRSSGPKTLKFQVGLWTKTS